MRRPQNLKKSPTGFDETAVFTQQRQNSGKFFQIFVAFSEKLDFKDSQILESMYIVSFNFYIDEMKWKITNEIESRLHSLLKLHHLTKKAVLSFPSPFLSFPFSYCEGFMVILQTKPSRIVQCTYYEHPMRALFLNIPNILAD